MQAIYACYQMHLCLLSNASMLAVKCIYACYQMYFCLLLNAFLYKKQIALAVIPVVQSAFYLYIL